MSSSFGRVYFADGTTYWFTYSVTANYADRRLYQAPTNPSRGRHDLPVSTATEEPVVIEVLYFGGAWWRGKAQKLSPVVPSLNPDAPALCGLITDGYNRMDLTPEERDEESFGLFRPLPPEHMNLGFGEDFHISVADEQV